MQAVGVFSGLAAGAWLGAAEAPTKVVAIGVSPVVISLGMAVGVFLARWSLPALIQGASYVRADLRQVPHLIIWAVLAGCLWAVANTLTIFAIRDIGLSIGFPLSNTNQLWGLLWGILVFGELAGGGRGVYAQVIGGAVLMALGAGAIALCSARAREQERWLEAAVRERDRYVIDSAYVRTSLEGREVGDAGQRRTWLDWLIVAGATATFVDPFEAHQSADQRVR